MRKSLYHSRDISGAMTEEIRIKVKCKKCDPIEIFEAKINPTILTRAKGPSDIIVYCPKNHPNKVRL